MKQLFALSDEAIVVSFNEGNTKAFDCLYNKYYNQVLVRCLSYTKCSSQASDLAQEIFIKVYHALNRFEGKSKFSTWLFSLTNNYCIDYLRKSKKNMFIVVQTELPDMADEEQEEETVNEVEHIMHDISELEKSLLTMKYKEGKSIQELCVLFDLKPSAVKMKLSRAKAKLNKMSTIAA